MRRTLTDMECDLAGDLIASSERLQAYFLGLSKYEPDMQPIRVRHVWTVARMLIARLSEIERSASARLVALENASKGSTILSEEATWPERPSPNNSP